jgi:hypothetical protein
VERGSWTRGSSLVAAEMATLCALAVPLRPHPPPQPRKPCAQFPALALDDSEARRSDGAGALSVPEAPEAGVADLGKPSPACFYVAEEQQLFTDVLEVCCCSCAAHQPIGLVTSGPLFWISPPSGTDFVHRIINAHRHPHSPRRTLRLLKCASCDPISSISSLSSSAQEREWRLIYPSSAMCWWPELRNVVFHRR